MEIDHNVCHGTISIPKYAGGPVPKSGRTFHIHHNWFRDSYSIEFVRNGVEIDHNLFDFDVQKDHGNLISGFGKAAAKGPASFHNNLVSNPGRGVIWINEVFNNLEIRNNHIITRTTATPRKDGLFGFNPGCDFKTISIRDNVIECQGQARPLLRCNESYGAVIRNNRLTNVSDTDRYDNPRTRAACRPRSARSSSSAASTANSRWTAGKSPGRNNHETHPHLLNHPVARASAQKGQHEQTRIPAPDHPAARAAGLVTRHRAAEHRFHSRGRHAVVWHAGADGSGHAGIGHGFSKHAECRKAGRAGHDLPQRACGRRHVRTIALLHHDRDDDGAHLYSGNGGFGSKTDGNVKYMSRKADAKLPLLHPEPQGNIRFPSIGDVLKAGGYATAHFGKWHLYGGGPAKHGFDESDGDTDNKGFRPTDPVTGQKSDTSEDPKLMFSITQRSVDFLEHRRRRASRSTCSSPTMPRTRLSARKATLEKNQKNPVFTKIENKRERANAILCAAMAEDLDTSIGLLLTKLDELRVAENTFVVFNADNGYTAWNDSHDPLRGGKWWLWENGLRVPMIVRGPGIAAGSRTTVNFVGYDFLPTFADLAGAEPSRQGSGRHQFQTRAARPAIAREPRQPPALLPLSPLPRITALLGDGHRRYEAAAFLRVA